MAPSLWSEEVNWLCNLEAVRELASLWCVYEWLSVYTWLEIWRSSRVRERKIKRVAPHALLSLDRFYACTRASSSMQSCVLCMCVIFLTIKERERREKKVLRDTHRVFEKGTGTACIYPVWVVSVWWKLLSLYRSVISLSFILIRRFFSVPLPLSLRLPNCSLIFP